MTSARALALIVGLGLMAACGTVDQGTATGPAAAEATPANSPTLTPGAYLGTPPPGHPAAPARLDLSRPAIFQTATCGDYPSQPLLTDEMARQSTVAVITIDAVKPPMYNTPDGARWTQAWYDAGHAVDVYTPYVVTVNRVVKGTAVSAGQQLVVFKEGGQMPNGDLIRMSCDAQPTGYNPQAGWQAVMGLGGPIPGLSLTPTVTLFAVIHDGGVVMPPGTPQPIP